MNYVPTIGLEIHAELKTASKMFCDCKNDPYEKRPNVNVCPICLGHPGTLPVINKKAVESVIRVGLTLGGAIAGISKFDRKNYFYPDLPKGYQISQYDRPLVRGGELVGVKIARVHLEEDTGSLAHADHAHSFVNFNRAGVPLMELVTEPVVHDAATALKFARELQLLLRYLGASDADMEKGQMRVEANVSLKNADGTLGTKVEVKNLNSFKAVEGAIAYEIERHAELLGAGKSVVQETRGWDDIEKKTVSQRSKEEAHDYRYFPEPDLPPLDVASFEIERIKQEIPELPWDKKKRFGDEYKLAPERVEFLVSEPELAGYFEKSSSEFLALCEENKTPDVSYDILYNYLTSDLRGLLNEQALQLSDLKFEPEDFAHLVFLAKNGTLSSRAAKDVLKKMIATGLDPEEVLKQENLSQIFDETELEGAVSEVIKENESAVADFKKGKENALQFLIGKAMAKLKGRGNPAVLDKIFRRRV